ncbi:MAG TPA: hypothetical protein ENO19_09960, partial [Halothiobacillaceae bacterium]|nr:hypothetical protein [Halothiobacillaceae bacterium]
MAAQLGGQVGRPFAHQAVPLEVLALVQGAGQQPQSNHLVLTDPDVVDLPGKGGVLIVAGIGGESIGNINGGHEVGVTGLERRPGAQLPCERGRVLAAHALVERGQGQLAGAGKAVKGSLDPVRQQLLESFGGQGLDRRAGETGTYLVEQAGAELRLTQWVEGEGLVVLRQADVGPWCHPQVAPEVDAPGLFQQLGEVAESGDGGIHLVLGLRGVGGVGHGWPGMHLVPFGGVTA